MYQANYGFTATGEHDPNVNVQPEAAEAGESGRDEKKEKNEKGKLDPTGKKRKAEEKPEWFDIDPEKNTNVYVSGLPDTTTEEQFVELMQKCGIIMEDEKGKMLLLLFEFLHLYIFHTTHCFIKYFLRQGRKNRKLFSFSGCPKMELSFAVCCIKVSSFRFFSFAISRS